MPPGLRFTILVHCGFILYIPLFQAVYHLYAAIADGGRTDQSFGPDHAPPSPRPSGTSHDLGGDEERLLLRIEILRADLEQARHANRTLLATCESLAIENTRLRSAALQQASRLQHGHTGGLSGVESLRVSTERQTSLRPGQQAEGATDLESLKAQVSASLVPGLGLGVLVNSESLYLLKVELISATKPLVPFNA